MARIDGTNRSITTQMTKSQSMNAGQLAAQIADFYFGLVHKGMPPDHAAQVTAILAHYLFAANYGSDPVIEASGG